MEGTRTAKVAVVRKDGSPLVTPVWFLVESDGTIVFTTGKHTVKGRALEHDPRLSFCVADDRPPFAFVRVDGVAELSDDPADLKRWATRIAERYMGTQRAQEVPESETVLPARCCSRANDTRGRRSRAGPLSSNTYS